VKKVTVKRKTVLVKVDHFPQEGSQGRELFKCLPPKEKERNFCENFGKE